MVNGNCVGAGLVKFALAVEGAIDAGAVPVAGFVVSALGWLFDTAEQALSVSVNIKAMIIFFIVIFLKRFFDNTL
ncbi:MAG: hypothetical protein A2240_02365 [Candidatus Jacksonbacteria bacterium RIFOXYA2_FULL_43_12]|nr:MAG: hypothetical protein A2240_02365 [Candidatus Jacksonbacteria bacterium RIFOXYA2_FULL_43_12]